MTVPGGGFLLPLSRVPEGGMVMDEVDTCINGIGKTKAWETWKVLLSLTKTFQELAKCPNLLSFATDEVTVK